MPTFHTTREHLRKLMDTRALKLPLNTDSVASYESWKQTLRAKIAELLGMPLYQSCPLNPQTLETVQMDGYRRVKMSIDTEPGVTMPFYVLLPDNPSCGKLPAVLAPHGHVSFGKEAVVGNGTFAQLRETIEAHNYDYGVQAVKQGIIALCPDARGFGERREKYIQGDAPEDKLSSSCQYLNIMAMGLGMNVAGMWTWDLMRLIDYAQSRDDVDA